MFFVLACNRQGNPWPHYTDRSVCSVSCSRSPITGSVIVFVHQSVKILVHHGIILETVHVDSGELCLSFMMRYHHKNRSFPVIHRSFVQIVQSVRSAGQYTEEKHKRIIPTTEEICGFVLIFKDSSGDFLWPGSVGHKKRR